MKRRSREQRRQRPLAVAAVVAALALAGCGGGGQPGVDTANPTLVKLSCFREISEAFLWNLDRFAKPYGIKVRCTEIDSYAESLQAAVRGDVDIAYSGIPQIASAADSQLSAVKVVAGYSLGGQNIVLRTGVNAAGWLNLEGKKVCVPPESSGAGIMARIAFLENQVDLSRLMLLPTGFTGTAELEAIRAGQCEALVMWSPFIDTAVVDGYAHYQLPQLDLNAATSVGAANGVVFAGPVLLSNRGLLVRFLKAYVASLNFMRSHTDQWLEVAVQVTGARREVVKEALRHQDLSYTIDVQGARAAARYGPRLGFTKADSSARISTVVEAGPLAEATGKSVETVTRHEEMRKA